MRRLFPVLALVAGLLLAAGLASSASHARLGAWATGTTLAVHGSAFAYFQATGRRIERLARSAGMPDWVGAQSEKNRRKAFVYETLGVPLAVLAGWLGEQGVPGAWSLGLMAANLAFQLGAFVGETASMMAQARLLRNLGTWASPAVPVSDSG